jgi:hypothetical protein
VTDRTALLEDPDRLAADPGATLRAWESRATPVAKLADRISAALTSSDAAALEAVACEVARSVLVDPDQDVGSIVMMVDAAASRAAPELRLGLLDLANALTCAGAKVAAESSTSAWLFELAQVGPPLARRLRVGFAGVVYGVLDLAIAPPHPWPFVGCLVFPGALDKLLAYTIAAAQNGGVARTLADAWRRVGEELGTLGDQLDEPTLLWIARALYQRFDGQPAGKVARLAHDHLWSVAADLEAARGEAAKHRPAFPVGDTLAGGAFRVEQRLLGVGTQRLYRGRDIASGAAVLVAFDDFDPKKQSLDELVNAVGYRGSGLFELAHAGTFDTIGDDPTRDLFRREHWTIVERVPAGDWLPRVLGPTDPWTAAQKAIALGRSAGRILLDAAEAGVVLAHVRPELMWADGNTVTGLSTRAIELFRRKRGELRQQPLFDRHYHAPEIHADPDDRAVAYALAVMVAEWATGQYPFPTLYAPDGVETAQHLPIAAPAPLARLLERTICRDPTKRPRLAELVSELAHL